MDLLPAQIGRRIYAGGDGAGHVDIVFAANSGALEILDRVARSTSIAEDRKSIRPRARILAFHIENAGLATRDRQFDFLTGARVIVDAFSHERLGSELAANERIGLGVHAIGDDANQMLTHRCIVIDGHGRRRSADRDRMVSDEEGAMAARRETAITATIRGWKNLKQV